ncbi:MAG TPA: carbonic anhydrase family protein [Ignavibacteria bacterium]|nr:carbonic anhydrase family protein [Ignavibacteria bacterium]
MFSCSEKKEEQVLKTQEKSDVRTEVKTAELQQSLNPQQILDSLRVRNERFASGKMTKVDYTAQVLKSESGQYPSAVILSCLDSRVPVESIFDLSIGDVFVARVAGNIVNPDILGSMEYGCKVAGSKLILVLGHSNCGAVKSAIDKVELGNITELLSKITPAVDSAATKQGDETSGNTEFVSKVTNENVKLAIDNIRKNSPILKEMEESGQIKIAGGVYNLENGKVTFLN